MEKILCSLVIGLILSQTIYADQPEYLTLQKNLAASVGEDIVDSVRHVLQLKTWQKGLPYLLSFSAVLCFDQQLDTWAKKTFPPDASTHNWDFVAYGGWAGLYLLGGDKERKVAVELARVYADSLVITTTLKHSIGRARPLANQGPYKFIGPTQSLYYNSFPSYHVSWAFAWATVLGREYNQNLLAYTIATYYSFAKPYEHNHWASDMLAGAIIGTYLGNMVFDKCNNPEDQQSNWQVMPLYDQGLLGASITTRF